MPEQRGQRKAAKATGCNAALSVANLSLTGCIRMSVFHPGQSGIRLCKANRL